MADPVFTGNASSDFSGPGSFRFDDPGGRDVGMPPAFPEGSVSGWDVKSLYFYYNRTADVMQVGIDFYGIAGDADSDGDPGHTGPILEGQGGVDEPDLNGTEAIVLTIDTDLDGRYDLAMGVNNTAGLRDFGAYQFVGRKYAPALGFGERLSPDPAVLFASPNASRSDLEFSIKDFSKLPGFMFVPSEPFGFRFEMYAGSFSDDGIGDDLVPGPDGAVAIFSPNNGTRFTMGGVA